MVLKLTILAPGFWLLSPEEDCDRLTSPARPTGRNHNPGCRAGGTAIRRPGILARAVRQPGHLCHSGGQPEPFERLHRRVFAGPYRLYGAGRICFGYSHPAAAREAELPAGSAILAGW